MEDKRLKGKRTLIVYYSVSGQTKKVAEVLAGQLGENCEILELETRDEIKPDLISRYTKGMKAMMSKETSVLRPYTFEADRYDRIILGFPNWASNCPPAMKKFIRNNQFRDKEIWLYTTYIARGGTACLNNVQESLKDHLQTGIQQITRKVRITIPSRKSKEQILEGFALKE